MRISAVARSSRRVLALALLGFAASLIPPQTASAATDAASLLKAGDVTALVGGSPSVKSTPQGQSCTWTGAKAGRRVVVLTYKKMASVPPEAAYMGARRSAAADEGAKIGDESGLGERAFSGQVSFGAVFVVLKHGQLLQLQYWTGGAGTSQDVAALRPVVRKAVAAF